MCLLIEQLQAAPASAGLLGKRLVRHERRLREARELMSQHYAQELTLERLAKVVGLSRMVLSTGFRELFGTTVHDYLQKVRMLRAYELLQEQGAFSIKKVAQAVGYKHASNFSTAFHAYFGFPPLKLRKNPR